MMKPTDKIGLEFSLDRSGLRIYIAPTVLVGGVVVALILVGLKWL